MALLESCLCCSLPVASALVGVYALVAYITAFTVELWWILEADGTLPPPAYLLAAAYFIFFVKSAFLLHGLSVKKPLFLLSWLFTTALLSFPEAGLVLFMSLQHWGVTTFYGLVEIVYWGCRLVFNLAGIICIQSQYATWKEEKRLLRRLQDLNMAPVPAGDAAGPPADLLNGRLANGCANAAAYQNVAFVSSGSQLPALPPAAGKLRRSTSVTSLGSYVPPPLFGGSLPSDNFTIPLPYLTPLNNLQYEFYGPVGSAATGSEFSASAFDGFFAGGEQQAVGLWCADPRMASGADLQRAQSVGDLRSAAKAAECAWPPAQPLHYLQYSPSKATQSLDRRAIRSAHSLHKLSSLEGLHQLPDTNSAYFNRGYDVRYLSRIAVAYPIDYAAFRRSRSFSVNCTSKRSLAESDDTQKIKDVAL